jgi:hypothetical protein
VIDQDIDLVSRSRPADEWATRRIWIAAVCGALLAGSGWLLDFWPLGSGGPLGRVLRPVLDLSRLLLLVPLAGVALAFLILAAIALWRRQFRRAASSVVAIAAIPVCFVLVAKVPLFDPWLWYVIANKAHFEAVAAGDPKYAVIETRDVSTGFAGLDPNHFVALIYDESDAVGLEPSERPDIWKTRSLWPAPDSTPIPKGRRLVGHFFRVDEFI